MNSNLHGIAWSLMDWFGDNSRDLPWRQNPEPYRVWVSEIMLQQTRVATVIPYFHRFLMLFPTVRDLAQAPLEDVLAAWAGLGYYRRARTLHRAAQGLHPDYELPSTLMGLLELPGVGRYTAGAIASIAYGIDAPIVDGNVMRVLCRIFGLQGDPYAAALNRELWSLAQEMIPPGNASALNQSMMELGALVCTPRGPGCDRCPVEHLCIARRDGTAEELPHRRRRTARKKVHLVLLIVRDSGGSFLVRRRAEDGLFGGMWEFPSMEMSRSEQWRETALGLAGQLGLDGDVTGVHDPLARLLTHRELLMTAVEISLACDTDSGHWVAAQEIGALGMPAAFKAVARHIGVHS